MRESSNPLAAKAIAAGASPCTVFADPLHHIDWLLRTSRLLWPNKTAEQLHAITGASIRTCKYWLAGTYRPQGSALIRLLAAVRARLDEDRARIEQFELTFD